jgi:LacI family transcriptional regulator
MASYLTRSKKLPDAFYFGADNTAYGGMMAMEDQGIRIPEDVMIVGFDNDSMLVPKRILKPLTTLAQPLFQMGLDSVRILLDDLEHKGRKKKRVCYYPELIIRETTR